MLQLAQRLGFDLADALARDVELLAHFFQRVVGAHLDAEAHAQHLGFARGQAVEDVLDHVAQAGLHGRFDRRGVVAVLDEVAQVAVVVVANRRFHGDRLLGDLHDLADLVLGNLHLLGQDAGVGLETELLQVLARDAVHLVDGLDHVHRDADGARLVGNRARDRLANPPRGVGRELVAAAVFELVHRLHQADVALLNQIEELQAAVGVLLGNRDHQAQVGLDHLFLGVARGGFAFVHALVDAFQLIERHHHLRLQVDQLLLQILDRRNVARHHRAPRLAGGGLFFDPFQVEHVRGDLVAGLVAPREVGDEQLLRVAALVDDDAAQFALVLAHVVHLAAQQVAQLLDGLGGEADAHQPLGQRVLRLHVVGRAPAFLVVGLVHLLEQRGDLVKALQCLGLELFQQARHGLGAALAVVVVFFVVFVEVFLGHVVVVFVGVGEAIDDGVDDHLAFADLGGHAQDFGNRRRAGADGFHHGHQAAFDALGNLDLALAREQLHRAHLAHVHAHRVGGAAKFRIDGGQRGFGGFFSFFLAGAGGRVVGDDQRLGIGRLLVHGHAQVVQRGDHGFKRLGVEQLVGQMVGDFDVRQVAARLAQFQQRLQVGAAQVHLFLGQHAVVKAEFLHQGAFLGLADLHAQRLDLLDHAFGRRGLGFGLAFQVGLDVRQVCVLDLLGARLARTAALGRCRFFSRSGAFGGAAGLLGGRSGGFLGAQFLDFVGRRRLACSGLGRRLGGGFGGSGLGGGLLAGRHQCTSKAVSGHARAGKRDLAARDQSTKRFFNNERRSDWADRRRGKMGGRTFGVQSLR